MKVKYYAHFFIVYKTSNLLHGIVNETLVGLEDDKNIARGAKDHLSKNNS